MQFGVFYEHQLPRPWGEDSEWRLFQEALDQVELADRLGIDYVWEVEHHFLEEYSHSSAPEVFLAACSQRTKRIRLGHGIVLMPPGYNHPARVAERIATLDLVSNGRVEFGTGESASVLETGGFDVPFAEKHAMWLEAVEQTCNMLALSPYPGFQGKHFSMPCRNVVPKPVQRPHPPLWVACSSRQMIHTAAKHGLGALTFSFIEPDEAKRWVDDYYETFERECVPLGHAVNPKVAMVAGFSCHRDREEAIRRGADGFNFFKFGLGWHYGFGQHKPGRSDLYGAYAEQRDTRLKELMAELDTDEFTRSLYDLRGLGTPAELVDYYAKFEAAGVDQIVFVQQSGNNRHEHICEALELFAAEVMPRFLDRHEAREHAKAERLAPAIARAMARKTLPAELPDDAVPVVSAERPAPPAAA